MKLSPIQVAASAAGAVLSALIASSFGVRGTVIGVAVGSVVATTASAVVGEWLTRTHHVVRKAVTKSPRPDGAAAGDTAEPEGGGTPFATGPTGPTGTSGTSGTSGTPGGVPSDRLVASSRIPSALRPGSPGSPRGSGGSGHAPGVGRRARPWRALAASVGIVFVVALATITVVEAIAGRPLSSLVGAGGPKSGTSAGDLLTTPTTSATTTTTVPPPATTTTTTAPPPTTTTTTTTPATTTTTTPGTTPTTAPSGTQGTATASPPTTPPATGTTTTTTTAPPASPGG